MNLFPCISSQSVNYLIINLGSRWQTDTSVSLLLGLVRRWTQLYEEVWREKWLEGSIFKGYQYGWSLDESIIIRGNWCIHPSLDQPHLCFKIYNVCLPYKATHQTSVKLYTYFLHTSYIKVLCLMTILNYNSGCYIQSI
jgi:hypothetical protein